jgi:hypothetical protein
MPKLTQQAAIIKALQARGYIEDGSTRKFRSFVIPGNDDPRHRMFVGKSGALRRGRISTGSISLERTPIRALLLKEGGYSC